MTQQNRKAIYFSPSGKINWRKIIRKEFKDNHTVIKSAMNRLTWYGAIMDDKTGEVRAYVVRVSVTSKRQNGFYVELKYKCETISEADRPRSIKCPKSIIKVLTPTKNANANRWRSKCMEGHKRKKPTAYIFRSLFLEIA